MIIENRNKKSLYLLNIATFISVLALHGCIASAIATMPVQKLKVPEIIETTPVEITLVKPIEQQPSQPQNIQSNKPEPIIEQSLKPQSKPKTQAKQKAHAAVQSRPITTSKPKSDNKPKNNPNSFTAPKPVTTVDNTTPDQSQWQMEPQLIAEREADLTPELETHEGVEVKEPDQPDAKVNDVVVDSTATGSGGTSSQPQTFSESDASWKTKPDFKSLASVRTPARSGDTINFTLKLTVDKQGNVTRAQVISSSGYGQLDSEAEKIAKQGKLYPFMNSSGNAVNGYLNLPITFIIK